MATPVRLPPIATDTTEGTLVRWLVAVGEEVEEGQILAEVDTAKVLFEVEAPAAGTVLGLVATEGQDVEVGNTLAWIGKPGEPIPDEAAQGGGGAPRAAPAVRRLAEQLGVDLRSVGGSGPGGRVLKEDVRRAAAGEPSPAAAAAAGENVSYSTSTGRPSGRMRSAVASATARAWHEIPHFYAGLEVDTSARSAEIAQHGFTSVVLACVASTLVREPVLNATYEEGRGIVLSSAVNLGVAVAVGDGLVVPVLRDAGRLTAAEIRVRLDELVARARAGRLSANDVEGVTFTVSNAGMAGVDTIVPIVHQPAIAILGVGQRRERPTVVNGAVVPRPTVRLVLACDHRAVDGLAASRWLAGLGRSLEGAG